MENFTPLLQFAFPCLPHWQSRQLRIEQPDITHNSGNDGVHWLGLFGGLAGPDQTQIYQVKQLFCKNLFNTKSCLTCHGKSL